VSLRLAQYAAAKLLPEEFLRELGLHDADYFGTPAVAMPWRDQDGDELAVHYRLSLDGPKADRFRWAEGTKAKGLVYGLDRWKLAAAAGWALLLEGESCAQTAWLHGVPAFGIPGAGMFDNELSLPCLEGIETLYVVQEPGKAGEGFVADLRSSRLGGRVRVISFGAEIEDVSDLHLSVDADREAFLAKLEGAKAAAIALPPCAESAVSAERPFNADRYRQLVTVPASEVLRERVRWLWRDRIPLGAVTLLAGDPGLGKSMLTCLIAAELSRGDLLDGEPACAILASAEDSLAATVRPRLEAAGAELERIELVEGVLTVDGPDGLTLPVDTDALAGLVEEKGARLLVVDPFLAHLDDQVNSWRDQSVRRAIAPLSRVAHEHACAVVLIVHLNKREGSDPLHRIGGSVGIPGAARSALLLVRDPDDPDGEQGRRRILAHFKSNVGELQESLLVEVKPILIEAAGDNPEVTTARVAILGPSSYTGAELLGRGIPDQQERTELEQAEDFLRAELADEAVPTRELQRLTKAEGISWATVRRAKDRLPIKARKEPGRFDGKWFWELAQKPDEEPDEEPAQEPPTKVLNPLHHLPQTPVVAGVGGAPHPPRSPVGALVWFIKICGA
jgi:hypothetical protein